MREQEGGGGEEGEGGVEEGMVGEGVVFNSKAGPNF